MADRTPEEIARKAKDHMDRRHAAAADPTSPASSGAAGMTDEDRAALDRWSATGFWFGSVRTLSRALLAERRARRDMVVQIGEWQEGEVLNRDLIQVQAMRLDAIERQLRAATDLRATVESLAGLVADLGLHIEGPGAHERRRIVASIEALSRPATPAEEDEPERCPYRCENGLYTRMQGDGPRPNVPCPLHHPNAIPPAAAAPAPEAPSSTEPTYSEADMEAAIKRADEAEEWADRLAYAIAPVEVIGEHSNLNHPWRNALDHLPAEAPSPEPAVLCDRCGHGNVLGEAGEACQVCGVGVYAIAPAPSPAPSDDPWPDSDWPEHWVYTATCFHRAYEDLAPEHGYETREASAVPFEEVPEPNRSLMIRTAGQVLRDLQDRGWTPAAPSDDKGEPETAPCPGCGGSGEQPT